MTETLQFVSAKDLRMGQLIRFEKYKSWWTVIKIDDREVIVKKGKSTKRLSRDYRVLQEIFDNLK